MKNFGPLNKPATDFLQAMQDRGHKVTLTDGGPSRYKILIRFKQYKEKFCLPFILLVEGMGATLQEAVEFAWISLGVETGKWEWSLLHSETNESK